MDTIKASDPKYKQTKQYIFNLINDNKLLPNQAIPSETELSKILGFSLITTRKALNELVNEHVIYRVQGKGSFVAEKKMTSINDVSKRLVVLVLSTSNESHDSSLMKIIKGLQSYLKKCNYSLIVECTEQDVEKERLIIDDLISKGIEGILLFSTNPESNLISIKRMRDLRIPFVMLDRGIDEYPVNFVGCNNFSGGFSATEHLLKLGHRNISFIAYNFFLSSEKERYQGYCKALSSYSINIDPKIVFLNYELDFLKLSAMIKKGEITAIFAANDWRAIEIIDLCIANDINIPTDVSIIGFDDSESTKYAKVSLSTVKQDFIRLGHEAAKNLISQINNCNLECKIVMLPTELIIRDSVVYNKNIKL